MNILVIDVGGTHVKVLASDPQFGIDPGRAFVYGQRATQFLLQTASSPNRKLQAVFRGHQQSPVLNPMMRRIIASRGIFRHWQENDSAALLNAAPENLARDGQGMIGRGPARGRSIRSSLRSSSRGDASGSRSKASGGAGLGLAIVKSIAASHGGQVEISSEVGRGTRVSLLFPAK